MVDAAASRRILGLKDKGVAGADIIVSLETGASFGTVAAYLAQNGFTGARRDEGLASLRTLHRSGTFGFREGNTGA